jgi:hypothetical protein
VHCSGKNGVNIEEAFLDLVKEILHPSPPVRPPSEHLFLERVKAIRAYAESKKDKKEKCIVS